MIEERRDGGERQGGWEGGREGGRERGVKGTRGEREVKKGMKRQKKKFKVDGRDW